VSCAKALRASIPAASTTARSDRRGLTLFELLITLVILIGMAGVTIVALSPLLSGARLEESARSCAQHLQMARAHARYSGRPVVVRSKTDSRGRILLESRTLSVFGSAAPGGELADADTLRGIAGAADREDADLEAELVEGGLIAESWSVTALSDRIRLDRVAPGGEIGGVRPIWMDDEVPGIMTVTSMVLAVFLPDGSAISPGSFFVIDADDRAAEVTIEPWTGRAQHRLLTEFSE